MLLISFLFHGFYEKYIVVRLLAAKERHPRIFWTETTSFKDHPLQTD